MSDKNKYIDDTGHNQKRLKTADEDPNAYAGADENSSDSEAEVEFMQEVCCSITE